MTTSELPAGHPPTNGRVRVTLHRTAPSPRRPRSDPMPQRADPLPTARHRSGTRQLVRAGGSVLALTVAVVSLLLLTGWLASTLLGLVIALLRLRRLRRWASRPLTLRRSPGGRHRRQPNPHGQTTIVENGSLVRLTGGSPTRRHRVLA
jgi:hypothetical protein